MTPVQDLNNLYFFAKVVDFGSYTAAAKALGCRPRSSAAASLHWKPSSACASSTARRGVCLSSPKPARRSIAIAWRCSMKRRRQGRHQPACWLAAGTRAHFLSHRSAASRCRRHPRALPRSPPPCAYRARRHQSPRRRRRRRVGHRHPGTQATAGGFRPRDAHVQALTK